MKSPADNRREAIALAYAQSDAAPRVVAKGRGLMAEQIINKAKEHGVYVHESPEMVALLMQVDLDQHIPPELYLAVAELLAFVYFLENQALDKGTDFDLWRLARSQPPDAV